VDGSLDRLHRVARSTVTVAVDVPADHASAPVLGTNRFGSGTIVGDGVVLTVSYVVVGAARVRVTDIEGHTSSGELVAHDFATGIAVVRADMPASVPIAAGDSRRIEVGQDAFVVASVGGDERRCATGAVTSVEPFDAYWEYRLERALWLTCPNPGLGGGPVCNTSGELVGIVSLNLAAVGRASLSIPSECYYEFADELLRYGRRTSRLRRAWLGLFCQAFPNRLVIAGVIPGSPAERAGLAPGDVLVRIDQRPFSSRTDLYQRIWAHEPGDMIVLEVFRDGEVLEFEIEGVDVDEFLA